MSRTTISTAMLPLVLCLLWGAGSAVAETPAKPVLRSTTISSAAVPYVAQTVIGASRQGSFSAGSIVWQCAGNRCTASGPAVLPAASACSELARTVGRVESYAYGANRLIDIPQCNALAGLAGAPGSTVKAPSTTGMSQLSKPQSTDKTMQGGSSSPVIAPAGMAQMKPSLKPENKPGAQPQGTPAGTPPSSTPTGTAGGPIRTVTLQFQGSGASLAALYPAFAPMRVTTVALQFQGSGVSLAALYPAFPPVTVRTVPLQVRAAGTLP